MAVHGARSAELMALEEFGFLARESRHASPSGSDVQSKLGGQHASSSHSRRKKVHPLEMWLPSRQQRVVPEVEAEEDDVFSPDTEREPKPETSSPDWRNRGDGDARIDSSVPRHLQGERDANEENVISSKGDGRFDSDDVELLSAVAPTLLEESAVGRGGKVQCTSERDLVRSEELGLESELRLACLKTHSMGVSDVIGSLDFDASGDLFATGGIARKVRVYSLEHLQALKEEVAVAAEERRSKSSGEDVDATSEDEEDLDEEVLSGEGTRRGRMRGRGKWRRSEGDLSPQGSRTEAPPFFMHCGNGGFRQKRKASSTNNLEEMWGQAQALVQGTREVTLDSDSSASKIICTAARLSSVQWVPNKKGVVGCGDYDGVFAEWDIESGMCVSERDDHHGLKIWSIKYCQAQGVSLAASASEDGCVKLWSAGSEKCVATVQPNPGSAQCSVDFSQDGRLLAMGGADAASYVYDLRCLATPLGVLKGHARTLSYARFMNSTTLVTSSIDSSVKVWGLGRLQEDSVKGISRPQGPMASADNHVNKRNFVGLAVRGDGLVLTGSETNEMVGYQLAGSSLTLRLRMSFSTGKSVNNMDASMDAGGTLPLGRKPFVSALSWQEHAGGHLLGAANSEGVVRIMRTC